jgi:predicted nuclease of predicted toxin-antitoxin system
MVRIRWQYDQDFHLSFAKEMHRDLILALRADSISMRAIRRLMLDDIRQDIHELERRRKVYLDHRQRRLNNAHIA